MVFNIYQTSSENAHVIYRKRIGSLQSAEVVRHGQIQLIKCRPSGDGTTMKNVSGKNMDLSTDSSQSELH